MSVEIEGLEFQVEAKSDKGADGIDKLANSFKNLKSAIKGGTNLNGSIKQLEKLNQALSGLHTDKLESLGKAMESLNKAGNIKIPASVPQSLTGYAGSTECPCSAGEHRRYRIGNTEPGRH